MGAPGGKASPQVFVIFGNDEFLVHSRASEVVRRLCPEGEEGFAVERIEGEGTETPEQILRNVLVGVRTRGLLGEKRILWLRGGDFLLSPSSQEPASRLIKELAEEVRRGLLPGVFLVVSGKMADQRSLFLRACREKGSVISVEKATRQWEKEEQGRRLALEYLKQAGLDAEPEAVAELVQRTGGEPGLLYQEITKLATYKHGTCPRISAGDVQALVPSSREAVRWEFADAVLAGDPAAALEILRRLLSQRHEIVGLLVGLEHRLRELSLIRSCLDRKWLRLVESGRRAEPRWSSSPEADELLSRIGDDPRQMHPYRLVLRCREASRFSQEQLRELRRYVMDVHLKVVGGAARPDILLELLVLRLVRAGKGRRAPA